MIQKILQKVLAKIFPKKTQWKKWSLPSKIGFISGYLTIIGFLVIPAKFIYSQFHETHKTQEVITISEYNELKQNIDDLEQLKLNAISPEEKLIYDSRLQTAINRLRSFEEDVQKLAEILSKMNYDTERFQSAEKLVDDGKYNEANKTLDLSEMEMDLMNLVRKEERYNSRNEELKFTRSRLSDEYLLKAKLSELDMNNSNRLKIAFDFYNRSIQIEKKEDNLSEFALFLYANNFKEAIHAFNDLIFYLESENENKILLLQSLKMLGTLYSKRSDFSKSKDVISKAIVLTCNPNNELSEIDKKITLANLRTDLANALLNLGDSTEARNNLEKSKMALMSGPENSIKVKHALASNLLNSAGSNLYTLDNSIIMSFESIELYRELVLENPAFKSELAKALINHGIFVRRKNDIKTAIIFYKEGLNVTEELYTRNPSVYAESFAITLNNLGNLLLHNENEIVKSYHYLKRGLDIRRQLMRLDKERFSPQVANSLYNISLYHLKTGDFEQALKSIDETITILEPIKEKSLELQEFYIVSLERREDYKKQRR